MSATTNDGSNLSADCIVTVKPYGGIWYKNYEISVTPNNQSFINPITIEGNITSITYTSPKDSSVMRTIYSDIKVDGDDPLFDFQVPSNAKVVGTAKIPGR